MLVAVDPAFDSRPLHNSAIYLPVDRTARRHRHHCYPGGAPPSGSQQGQTADADPSRMFFRLQSVVFLSGARQYCRNVVFAEVDYRLEAVLLNCP